VARTQADVLASLRATAVRTLVRGQRRRWAALAPALIEAGSAADVATAARLLRRASRSVATGSGRLRIRPVRDPLPEVAILARSQFTPDARMLAAALGAERALLIPRDALKALAQHRLPAGIGDLTYRQALEEDAQPMLDHRAFLADVWRALDPQQQVRLVMTANAGYWAEVEFGGALEENGVPFVALHKENLKSPGHAARWLPVYRDQRAPFRGRAVLVQNRGEAALQVESGIVPAGRVAVVGMARLDGFHAHRRRTAGSTVDGDVLFAGFLPGLNLPTPVDAPGRDPVLGLPLPDPDPRAEHLLAACLALHRVAVATARRLPQRRIVVKTKGRDQDRRWTPVILAHVAGDDGVPDNLVVRHGGDAAAMTREAGVVVGLNSTMLLEAIAAGRPAVVLELGEMQGPARPFLIDCEGAATIVRDEAQAVPTIVGVLDAAPTVPRDLPAPARALLERWTGNADGDATPRTVARLTALLRGSGLDDDHGLDLDGSVEGQARHPDGRTRVDGVGAEDGTEQR